MLQKVKNSESRNNMVFHITVFVVYIICPIHGEIHEFSPILANISIAGADVV